MKKNYVKNATNRLKKSIALPSRIFFFPAY